MCVCVYVCVCVCVGLPCALCDGMRVCWGFCVHEHVSLRFGPGFACCALRACLVLCAASVMTMYFPADSELGDEINLIDPSQADSV